MEILQSCIKPSKYPVKLLVPLLEIRNWFYLYLKKTQQHISGLVREIKAHMQNRTCTIGRLCISSKNIHCKILYKNLSIKHSMLENMTKYIVDGKFISILKRDSEGTTITFAQKQNIVSRKLKVISEGFKITSVQPFIF